MLMRVGSIVVLGAVAALTTAALTTQSHNPLTDPGLTVHEWGTFTTVAGADGRAIDWLPLGGPTDLPCFVSRFGGGIAKVLPDGDPGPTISYDEARRSMWGKVRMETPVLYFYSAQD